jgi:hypothetical protein
VRDHAKQGWFNTLNCDEMIGFQRSLKEVYARGFRSGRGWLFIVHGWVDAPGAESRSNAGGNVERLKLLAVVVSLSLIAGCSSDEVSGPSAFHETGDAEFIEDAELRQLESEARVTIARLEEVAEGSSGVVGSMSRTGQVVWLDPGSDGLESAVAHAGEGGVVVLRPGLHFESGTVTIEHRVSIVGEAGAILEVDTAPMLDYAVPLEPALHILEASGTVIWGVAMRPHGPIGGTAILVEDSQGVVLAYNTIMEHQYSVMLELADRVVMLGNEMTVTDAWLDGTIPEAVGVVICNAERAVLSANAVTGGLFGFWVCDQRGVMLANRATASYLGFIFCKVPGDAYVLPRGNPMGADYPATRWVAKFNQSSDCLDANYIVIDGANNNLLAFNESNNPGTYDVELVGDSYRFGFLTPFSYENTVLVGNSHYVVKDCGEDNTVIGGVMVDTDVGVCF